MAAGTCHLESALHILLTLDLREVEIEIFGCGGKLLAGVDYGRLDIGII